MMFRATKCIPKNYYCESACPCAAIKNNGIKNGCPEFDRSICDKCLTFECVNACMKEALKIAGRYYSVDELMKILKRDHSYWGENGGVTFTGGEPLMQKEFLLEILKKCRSNYIHAAVETCALVPTETILQVQKLADFMFIDIKHMDSSEHKKETGAGNELILKNVEAAASAQWDGRLIIRVPIIPGFNDGEENLIATAEFMNRAGLAEVNILSFHRLGTSKYGQLGLEYKFAGTEAPPEGAMTEAVRIYESFGIKCHIDSKTPF
jgi:pyruvate formate lyase activating enzyme